jgi:hypothetical protein
MRNHERRCVHPDAVDAVVGNSTNVEDLLMDEVVDDDDAVVLAPADGIEDRRVPCVDGLDNFDHLTQFLKTGRCVCSEEELQLVKFMHMAQDGYGVSRHFSKGMLEYCKGSGGQNLHLPASWARCVEETTRLIECLEGERKTFHLDVTIPEDVRAMLADPCQTHIGFEFECPITEMIRIAMLSETCQSWENVALSYEDNKGYLDDFCNGERYKRIAADLSPGGAILGAVLATDGICLDKCMFDSQEVRVVIAELDWVVDWVLDGVVDWVLDWEVDWVLD